MGSKNSTPPQQTAPPPQHIDPNAMLGPMQHMMAQMMQQNQVMQQQMMENFQASLQADLESEQNRLETDWEAERQAIRDRLENLNQGVPGTDSRDSTFVTSPLLDDEDPDVLEPVVLTS